MVVVTEQEQGSQFTLMHLLIGFAIFAIGVVAITHSDITIRINQDRPTEQDIDTAIKAGGFTDVQADSLTYVWVKETPGLSGRYMKDVWSHFGKPEEPDSINISISGKKRYNGTPYRLVTFTLKN